MNIPLKPWSEAKPAAVLFAEKIVTAKGEVRWRLPERKKIQRKRRLEALETPRKKQYRRSPSQLAAVRLFKAKKRDEGFCSICYSVKADEGFKTCAPCRQRHIAYMDRIREAQVLEGICIGCATNEATTGRYCEECRETARIKRRERRMRLKAAGLCCQCHTQPVEGKRSRCSDCEAKQRASNQKRRADLAARGVCVRCGVNESPAGESCIACRETDSRKRAKVAARGPYRTRTKEDIEAARVLRLERLAAGYCRNCSLRRPEEGKANCAPCRLRRAARGARSVKARRSGNLCSRCGEAEAPAGKYCDDCREAGRIKLNARRAERAAAGLCKSAAAICRCLCGTGSSWA